MNSRILVTAALVVIDAGRRCPGARAVGGGRQGGRDVPRLHGRSRCVRAVAARGRLVWHARGHRPGRRARQPQHGAGRQPHAGSAHTHHVALTDGAVSVITGGYRITGAATITSNGATARVLRLAGGRRHHRRRRGGPGQDHADLPGRGGRALRRSADRRRRARAIAFTGARRADGARFCHVYAFSTRATPSHGAAAPRPVSWGMHDRARHLTGRALIACALAIASGSLVPSGVGAQTRGRAAIDVVHYDASIDPDLQAGTIVGAVRIRIAATAPTDVLTLDRGALDNRLGAARWQGSALRADRSAGRRAIRSGLARRRHTRARGHLPRHAAQRPAVPARAFAGVHHLHDQRLDGERGRSRTTAPRCGCASCCPRR